MKKIREKINKFFQGRHGMDELNLTVILVSIIIYMIGCALKNGMLLILSLGGIIFVVYRAMSKQEWDRNEENRQYIRYIKLWKVRWQERKTSRIYMCKSCGRMIRVPKGKGKIQVTCPSCGSKKIWRT